MKLKYKSYKPAVYKQSKEKQNSLFWNSIRDYTLSYINSN